MRITPVILRFLVICSLSLAAFGQWSKQNVDTKAGFRGLAVVSDKVIWASGTGGTVVRTVDGGANWKVMTVPGGEKLDFRDIEAFDANTAYILSIGNGDSSRVYKTSDGGATWVAQFTAHRKETFFDAIACWDKSNCIAMSDPVNGRYVLISTSDGGANWKYLPTDKLPAAVEGEAAFAASGTCLIAHGKSTAFLVSGGTAAHVFRSDDRGKSWASAEAPMAKGTAGSGIFSIAMQNGRTGVIVGGNYEDPKGTSPNLAFTADGGQTWKAAKGFSGYRSGVAYVGDKTVIAVGTSGSDISTDGGKTWRNMDAANYNVVQAKGKNVWAAGPAGLIAKRID
jgi:photosystem II stability/assembly factor-like uncharacterized protein